ncbi:uncharacterized protein LOC129597856 [Paramacrobiotus metropolitanus]|uniref:uncharacterized protein LOC129597856 n=1 Tax=Paramacrobiotus metropolitanus TaxID=2943436 RepID=UPI002445F804|nr:uncharacterized protein LOC129597856 [Paramacrobiotus metropolitanus]
MSRTAHTYGFSAIIFFLSYPKSWASWYTNPGDPSVAKDFPHPLCNYNGPYRLECTKADLRLPGNFNISALANTSKLYNFVNYLTLDCPTSAKRTYCNTVGPGAQPLSYREWIWDVTLIGFQAEGGGRAPINVLLSKLPTLLRLQVHYSRIGTLDKNFLQNFKYLEEFDVRNNDISAIDIHALEPLANLNRLKMGGNLIQKFDWGALKPVAEKLYLLELDGQNPPLKSLQRSGPLFSINITNLLLNNSRLSMIPKDVVDTFEVRQYFEVVIDVRNNPFCPNKGDCSCCEMKDLANWFEKRTSWAAGSKDEWKHSTTVSANCGPTSNTGNGNSVKEFTKTNPLLPRSYEKCK